MYKILQPYSKYLATYVVFAEGCIQGDKFKWAKMLPNRLITIAFLKRQKKKLIEIRVKCCKVT